MERIYWRIALVLAAMLVLVVVLVCCFSLV